MANLDFNGLGPSNFSAPTSKPTRCRTCITNICYELQVNIMLENLMRGLMPIVVAKFDCIKWM
jgi:hypothetical protein